MAEADRDVIDLAFLVALGFSFLVGAAINIFIVAVNLADWLKRRQLSDSDKVLTWIGISRLGLQITTTLTVYGVIFFQMDLLGDVRTTSKALRFVEFFFNYSSIWFSTLLSFFYMVKIANFRHSVFVLLKERISRFLQTLGVSCLLLAFINTLLLFLWPTNINGLVGNSTRDLNDNATVSHTERRAFVYLFVSGNCLPLAINAVSLTLLLVSLLLHIRQMRGGSSHSFSSPNLDKYYTAIKSMILCFLIYSVHIGIGFAGLTYSFSANIIWIQIMTNFFPTLHSLFLIIGTAKLRQQFSSIIHWAAKGFSKESATERRPTVTIS
ncbi:taste receptor type 2 member 116 [Xenopus laevis]|uniref:Taste receptor type 2 n=2 Tax=Xenopus laevis TaxID=8355 RepID=A0A1L8GC95_XENLA|nr:taste receptor type 2 member 116 [Xenopus laevis]OCT81557.1 hypothetical protein XELAEV_18028380mg [Xenopus laevis]